MGTPAFFFKGGMRLSFVPLLPLHPKPQAGTGMTSSSTLPLALGVPSATHLTYLSQALPATPPLELWGIRGMEKACILPALEPCTTWEASPFSWRLSLPTWRREECTCSQPWLHFSSNRAFPKDHGLGATLQDFI